MNFKNKKQLVDLFFFFLKIGTTGFGGPLSVISLLQKELVEEKKWLSLAEFNQAFALIKAMPGPISFMMVTYLGQLRRGFVGALLAALGFVLPSFAMIIFIGHFYTYFQEMKGFNDFVLALQVSAFALIVLAIKNLTQKEYKNPIFVGLAVVAGYLYFNKLIPEPFIILGFGGLYILYKKYRPSEKLMALVVLPSDEWSSYWLIFQKCLKAGALIFGTGFAMLPVMHADFVIDHQWLSESEFLNAVAFGQITPGPIVITGTYVGYKILGFWGAVVATIGIFLPSFFHITTWFSWAVQRAQKQVWIADFVFAATAAVVGTIVITFYQLSKNVNWNFKLVALFFISLAVFHYLKKIPVILVFLLAGMTGVLVL